MSGWVPALLLIGGAVLLMIGFNARMWRAHKALVQARVDYGPEDFLSDCNALGVSREVGNVLLQTLRHCYPAELTPKLSDNFAGYLGVDPEELEEIVETCWRALGWSQPSGREPVHIPVCEEVGDLALWLEAQRSGAAAQT